jgi:hypothetical protein
MILIKSALPSILVLLGACERSTATEAIPGPSSAATVTVESAGSSPAATTPSASSSSQAATTDGGSTSATVRPPTGRGRPAAGAAGAGAAAKTVYVCPMHPEITSDAPGLCPKCNMKLELKPRPAEVHAEGGGASQSH